MTCVLGKFNGNVAMHIDGFNGIHWEKDKVGRKNVSRGCLENNLCVQNTWLKMDQGGR